MQVAIDWWEVHLTEKVISVWIGRTKQSLMVLQGKMSHAAAHYEWFVCGTVLRFHRCFNFDLYTGNSSGKCSNAGNGFILF